MVRSSTLMLCLLGAIPTLATAAEPRDNPVLVDFSETDQAVTPGKELLGDMLTAVEGALRAACGSSGAPTVAVSYKGTFLPDQPRQQIHFASCGAHPFLAPRVFAITSGVTVVGQGSASPGKTVRLVEDLDDDGQSEVVLQDSVLASGVTKHHAKLVTYTSGAEVVLQDFGLVYTSSDSSAEGCMERAAVIFLRELDPKKMTRKDYRQPCGGEKEWKPIGDNPLQLAD